MLKSKPHKPENRNRIFLDMDKLPQLGLAQKLLSKILKVFFHLLYHPLAWSYDLIAFIVSAGMWNQWVLSILDQIAGPKVLELGFGPGHLQTVLQQKSFQAFGLDASPQMVRLASRRLHRLGLSPNLTLGRAQELPFPSNSFDQVISTFPSEYIFHPETIGEICRVLKPQGSTVILIQAEIQSPKLLHRVLAWLFRFTGQTQDWNAIWEKFLLQPFEKAGMTPKFQTIDLGNSLLQVILAEKSPVFHPGLSNFDRIM